MICTKCKKEKDEVNFRERKTLKSGYNSWCRTCEREANRSRYIPKVKNVRTPQVQDKEKVRLLAKKRMLKSRYNLEYETYLEIYEKQNGKCGICFESNMLGGHNGLYVDHCHQTGKVRGLLCSNCNTAIGKLKESKERFESALRYLNRAKE